MKGGKQKIGKPGAGSLETFLTTDGIRMGTGWDQSHRSFVFNPDRIRAVRG